MICRPMCMVRWGILSRESSSRPESTIGGAGEMSVLAIFDLCEPNADVRTGTSSDSDFAADLSRVIRGTGGPVEYRGDHLNARPWADAPGDSAL